MKRLIAGGLIVCLTIVLVALTVLAWKQGFWSLPARLHYTLLAPAALADGTATATGAPT